MIPNRTHPSPRPDVGALVVGGVATRRRTPRRPAPSSADPGSYSRAGPPSLRPAQDVPDADCPNEGGDTGDRHL